MQADTKLPIEQQRGYKNGVDALLKMARNEGLAGFFVGTNLLFGLKIKMIF